MEIILNPPSSPIIGHILSFPIRFYGIVMAICFFIGICICYHIFKTKHSIKEAEVFIDYSPLVILFSLFGARLFYVLGSFGYYRLNPLEILFINHGGLSIFGAIIAGVFAMLFFSRLKKFDFFSHCDVIALCLPICQAIGRLGNYFNQEAFGLPSDFVIKLFVDKQFRPDKYSDIQYFHPTFLYEAILNLILFIVLMTLTFKLKNIKKGTITGLYLILYSVIRFLVESIRVDSILNIGIFPVAQLISIILFVVGILILFYSTKKASN